MVMVISTSVMVYTFNPIAALVMLQFSCIHNVNNMWLFNRSCILFFSASLNIGPVHILRLNTTSTPASLSRSKPFPTASC
ncbi:hypothetical protein FKM82_004729 [Ascaphus truei]